MDPFVRVIQINRRVAPPGQCKDSCSAICQHHVPCLSHGNADAFIDKSRFWCPVLCKFPVGGENNFPVDREIWRSFSHLGADIKSRPPWDPPEPGLCSLGRLIIAWGQPAVPLIRANKSKSSEMTWPLLLIFKTTSFGGSFATHKRLHLLLRGRGWLSNDYYNYWTHLNGQLNDNWIADTAKGGRRILREEAMVLEVIK